MPKKSPEPFTSPLSPLIAQLFYEAPPVVDMARLTERVQARCGRVDTGHLPAPGSDMAHYFMLDAMASFQGGAMPTGLCLATATGMPSPDSLASSLQQTWDWDDAAATVSRCRHALVANDLMAAPLDCHVRNRQFRGFVRAVQEVAPCQAIHFMCAGLVADPRRFVYGQDEEEPARQLYGTFNARFFNIEGTGGDMLMDTMGLAVLGLPDVQCHFRNLPPPEVANKLYDLALYLFRRGDIIHDGETIPGLQPEDAWRCQHENSLVGPKRIVLDVNPGPPFAAGGR